MNLITLDGREYVVLPRREYEVLAAEAAGKLPPLPEPDADGLTPAVEYGKVLLARKLIQRRETVGLSQTALAKAARIRPEVVNRVERGKVNPTEATLNKMLRALDRAEAGKGKR